MNDPFIGSQIAGYRVERILGRGGMASVYFAWDTTHDRPVALKVMDERYRETPSFVDRFIQEAQTIATWDQPNIVKVYDAGEEGGVYYYAMEFIRGLDLAQLLRQYLDAGQLMPYNEVVRVGWAVSDALDFAHNHGIVHRDVKPSNVLVSVDGRILLTDFGLVMDINRGTLGETFGSPSYIAPEQARNSAGAVPQSDNYALGVMLYEMLTGAVPFYDASPTSLALKHLTEEPPAPRSLNPRLSQGVEAVLLRALRKRPNERYATGREMLSALEYALGPELSSTEASSPQPLSSQTQFLQTARAQRVGQQNPAPPPPNGAGYADTQVSGANASPVPPMDGNDYAQNGPGTSVRPAYRPSPPPSSYPPAGQQQYAAGTAGYNAPVYGGPPSAVAPPRRGIGFGCLLAALLAVVLLAVGIGAAYSAFSSGALQLPAFVLPGPLPSLTPWATQTPKPGKPTRTPAPPTRTAKPSNTPVPSLTPVPPTATVPATDTPIPTLTAPPPSLTPEPVYNMVLARQRQDGILLLNTGDIPIPMASLALWSNDELRMRGTQWGLDLLQPGECVSVWLKTVKPSFPTGIRCKPVGQVLTVDKNGRFWTDPVEIRFNDQPVFECKPDEARCEFDNIPQ